MSESNVLEAVKTDYQATATNGGKGSPTGAGDCRGGEDGCVTDYDAIDTVRRTAVVERLSDVQPERVEWLWPNRVPLGKLTVLEGDPGLGKSMLTLDLAARLSVGGHTCDGHPLPTAGTVLLTAEDGLADTVRPRVDAAGGDPAQIVALVAVQVAEGEELPELPTHIEAVAAAIEDAGARLVIVDPLVAYLPASVNSWRDHDIRRALRPLATLAEDTGAAVVVVRHLTKGAGPAVYRGGGSIGIIAAARSALLVARDPEDEGRRVLASVKCSNGREPESLAFRVEDDGQGRARVVWGGTSPHRANALTMLPEDPDQRPALDEAVDVLREALAGGPRPVRDVERIARESGVELRTLRRARQRIGVRSSPDGFGGPRLLSLPEPSSSVDHSVVSDGQYQNRVKTGNTVVNTERDPSAIPDEQHLEAAQSEDVERDSGTDREPDSEGADACRTADEELLEDARALVRLKGPTWSEPHVRKLGFTDEQVAAVLSEPWFGEDAVTPREPEPLAPDAR
jgi:hypothetical protein